MGCAITLTILGKERSGWQILLYVLPLPYLTNNLSYNLSLYGWGRFVLPRSHDAVGKLKGNHAFGVVSSSIGIWGSIFPGGQG